LLYYAIRLLERESKKAIVVYRYALIGDNISHSLSPALFEAAGYPKDLYSYNLIESKSLKKAIDYLIERGYGGANITAPFKEEAPSYCHIIDKSVEMSGAANLITIEEGTLKCYNTDIKGVIEPIKERGIESSKALVVGSGGAAAAAIWALKTANFQVTVAARNREKVEEIVERFKIESTTLESLNNSKIKEFPLLIYTLPTLIEPLSTIELKQTTIIEANYRDPSLKEVESKEYIGGREWLLYQAVEGFELLTNLPPKISEMRKVVNRG